MFYLGIGISRGSHSQFVFTWKPIANDWMAYKGPVTLRSFLSNLSRNAIARQVAGELRSVHGLSRNFFVTRSVARSRTQLYFLQRIAAIFNNIAQCITPPATSLAILRQF